jgi:hypothetical protein
LAAAAQDIDIDGESAAAPAACIIPLREIFRRIGRSSLETYGVSFPEQNSRGRPAHGAPP